MRHSITRAGVLPKCDDRKQPEILRLQPDFELIPKQINHKRNTLNLPTFVRTAKAANLVK